MQNAKGSILQYFYLHSAGFNHLKSGRNEKRERERERHKLSQRLRIFNKFAKLSDDEEGFDFFFCFVTSNGETQYAGTSHLLNAFRIYSMTESGTDLVPCKQRQKRQLLDKKACPITADFIAWDGPGSCKEGRAGSPFLDLSITYGTVSTKIYDKRDNFYFEKVTFHFLMEMFLTLLPMLYTFCYVFVLQKYVQISMTSTTETHYFTSKLIKQGYRYHKLRKAFSKFYYSH